MTNPDQLLEDVFSDDSGLTDKQKRIVDAAIESFAEKGFAATSTKEIAQKAGVAEGTIFRHYKTKKELLFSIVTPLMLKTMAPIIMKDLNKVLDNGYEHFEDFVRAMIENRKEFLEKNMRIIQILIQEIPFHRELREQFVQQIGTKVYARFVQIIEHFQAKGQIIDVPASSVIRIIGSMAIGFFVAKYAIAPGKKWDDELEIDRMIHILMSGIARA